MCACCKERRRMHIRTTCNYSSSAVTCVYSPLAAFERNSSSVRWPRTWIICSRLIPVFCFLDRSPSSSSFIINVLASLSIAGMALLMMMLCWLLYYYRGCRRRGDHIGWPLWYCCNVLFEREIETEATTIVNIIVKQVGKNIKRLSLGHSLGGKPSFRQQPFQHDYPPHQPSNYF